MDWMDLLLDSVRSILKTSSPRELSNLIGALAMARYQPDEDWVDELMGALEVHLGEGLTAKVDGLQEYMHGLLV
jgi:hypothetical protein